MSTISRRTFAKKTGLALSLIPFYSFQNSFPLEKNEDPLNVHIFSKHLQFLGFDELGKKAKELGFDGIDLTVRPNGHVEPEYVEKDLPKAISAINKSGSSCIMITTAIKDAKNETDINILKTATKLGITYYRPDWFKYFDATSMEEDLEHYQQKIKELSHLNNQLGVIGCYQNHAGKSIGSSIWEIKKLLEFANLNTFGVQYDIRHAMVEGALSWENGLELINTSIKTIVLKDYKWGQVNGIWQPINVPIGEGMVNFKSYFSLLKKYQIKVPVSLHLEYPLGGAEKGNSTISIDEKIVFNAMKKDLEAVRKLWKEAE